jgi:hypothetical protein
VVMLSNLRLFREMRQLNESALADALGTDSGPAGRDENARLATAPESQWG